MNIYTEEKEIMVFWEFKFDGITWQLTLELLLRLVVSALCGAVVGFERSKRLKEAGVRTHCVVAISSALFMIVSKYGFADMSSDALMELFGSRGADTSRIAAQVVSGISFLGAGVIFKNGNVVRGITTAAGIWATAAIGLTIGSGLYIFGIAATILIMIVQMLMHRFPVGNDAFNTNEILITMIDSPEARKFINTDMKGDWALVIGSKMYRENDKSLIQVTIKCSGAFPPEKMMQMMDEHPEIISISM